MNLSQSTIFFDKNNRILLLTRGYRYAITRTGSFYFCLITCKNDVAISRNGFESSSLPGRCVECCQDLLANVMAIKTINWKFIFRFPIPMSQLLFLWFSRSCNKITAHKVKPPPNIFFSYVIQLITSIH